MTRSKVSKHVGSPGSQKLPRGWAVARLGDVATFVNGFAFSPSQWREAGLPIIRIQNLNDVNAPFNYFDGTLPDRYRVQSGDLLFAWSGTPGTSFGAHVWTRGDAWLNQHIFRVDFDHDLIDADYFRAAINYNLDQYIAAAQGGSGLAHINKRVLTSSWIRIAPYEEQRRIVAAIQAVEREVEEGRSALVRARQTLHRYMRGTLRTAVEGTLTADWREGRQTSMSAPAIAPIVKDSHREQFGLPLVPDDNNAAVADRSQLFSIPASWAWTTVGAAGELRLGRQRSPKPRPGAKMVPYLRVANVFEDRIDTTDVLQMPFTPNEVLAYRLNFGDVLLNEGQSLELVGRPAMYRDEVPGACFQNTLIRFRAASHVVPEFALLVFRHYLHSRRFQRAAKRTTNIAHLSVTRFAAIEFPLPPVDEQREIVARAQTQLAHIVENERVIADGLARSAQLYAAALQRAFEGRLTHQDPADEPADHLLTRIAESRERAIAAKVTAEPKFPRSIAMPAKRPSTILEILKAHPDGLTPEDLFRAAYYDLSHVDDFYAELRQFQPMIEEIRPPRDAWHQWPQGAAIVLRAKE